jgi:hypothetical protein
MGKASSNKKVARAARAGGRRSSGPRQRNLMFPSVIGAVVLLGTGLVVFAANDRKSETDIAPVANQDHWHAAFGVYICGEFEEALPEFESGVGIHTHGDGVIHIHPFVSAGAGENATLGTFLEEAGVELTDDSLTIGDQTWTEGEDDCDGEDAELVLAQWKDVQSTDENPALIRRDFGDTRFRDNGEGYTLAFVPEGTTDIPKPDSAAQLAELGALDDATATSVPEGEVPPEDTTDTTAADDGSTDTTAVDEGGTSDTTAPPEG